MPEPDAAVILDTVIQPPSPPVSAFNVRHHHEDELPALFRLCADINETIATNLLFSLDIGRGDAATEGLRTPAPSTTGIIDHRPGDAGTDWHLAEDGDGAPWGSTPPTPNARSWAATAATNRPSTGAGRAPSASAGYRQRMATPSSVAGRQAAVRCRRRWELMFIIGGGTSIRSAGGSRSSPGCRRRQR
jgi:hypothetical protein